VPLAGCGRMTVACAMRNVAGTRPPSSSGVSGCGCRQPSGWAAGTRVRRDQRWTLGRIKTLIGKLFHVGYTAEGCGS